VVFQKHQSRLEDVKKLISLSFRDFIFDPKCLPTPQRSLIRHPRAIFLTPSSPQILKSIFSHLPDDQIPNPRTSRHGGLSGSRLYQLSGAAVDNTNPLMERFGLPE
jgi:hypothetical protein